VLYELNGVLELQDCNVKKFTDIVELLVGIGKTKYRKWLNELHHARRTGKVSINIHLCL